MTRCGFGFGARLRLARRTRLFGLLAAAGFPGLASLTAFALARLLLAGFAVARLAPSFAAAAALAGFALALAPALARAFVARDGGNRFGRGGGFGCSRFFSPFLEPAEDAFEQATLGCWRRGRHHWACCGGRLRRCDGFDGGFLACGRGSLGGLVERVGVRRDRRLVAGLGRACQVQFVMTQAGDGVVR